MSPSVNNLLPCPEFVIFEERRLLSSDQETDSVVFIAADEKGNKLCVSLNRRFLDYCCSEVYLKLDSQNTIYIKNDEKYTASGEWKTNDTLAELIEPMKIWRLCYNGLLNRITDGNTCDESPCDQLHVRFYFLWHPLSAPVFLKKSADPIFFVRNGSLTERSIYNGYDGSEQWGTLHGNLHINEDFKIELNMKCLKRRNWGTTERNLHLVVFMNDGAYLSVNSCLNTTVGHMRKPTKHVILSNSCLQLSSSDLQLNDVVHITGKDKNWKIHQSIELKDNNCNNMLIKNVNYIVNEQNAVGYYICYKRRSFSNKPDCWLNQNLPKYSKSLIDLPLTIDLISDLSLNVGLVGGKASSLAKMTFLKKHKLIENVVIPFGFCITVHAMNSHLYNNKLIQERLAVLQTELYTLSENTDLMRFLDQLKDLWLSCTISETLKSEISKKVDLNKKYAVRSSGILEDGANFSFAGQNSTFLNVNGVENILNAVKQCWASLYSFQSVTYRREHGIDILSEMGVIVQEMVQPEISGVLFTREPLTGDERYITLSYCFDLGEEVVSGHSIPNTVYYDRGEKLLTKMKTMDAGRLSEITEYDNLLHRLCSFSENLETILDYSLDIEWAITGNEIYFLQCRPITTIFSWTDFEILHELDTAYTENDIITFHNAGEIMTGANSPLGMSFVEAIIEESSTYSSSHPSCAYTRKLLATIQFKSAVNLLNTLLLNVKEEIPFEQRIVDMTACGRFITDDKMYEIARKKNGTANFGANINELYTSLAQYSKNSRVARKAKNLEKNFRINADRFSDVNDLFRNILQQAQTLKKVSKYHLITSSADVFLKVLTLSMMSNKKVEELDNCITYMSSVLSQAKGTVSCEVPYFLKKIADTIKPVANEFLNIDPTHGCDWLKNNHETGYKMLMEFFNEHGFRGINEMDLMSETWSTNPAQIVEILQSLVKAAAQSPKAVESTNAQPFQGSYNARHPLRRTCLNLLLSRCQNSVRYREQTKRSLVAVVNQFRLAFKQLSQLMFRANLLPEPKAIFFLTLYELNNIINYGKQSVIFNKVLRRRKLWNFIENAAFPNVIIGLPQAINEQDTVEVDSSDQVQGFSVTNNSVRGRACLLHSVNEASKLQSGDILVTRSIDIGWSPYFPVLGGIVTELGGFISHGAVIAREYGIPCVVSAPNATKIFQTGDTIEITGSNGIVHKVPATSPDTGT